jgi:hypothetical protein
MSDTSTQPAPNSNLSGGPLDRGRPEAPRAASAICTGDVQLGAARAWVRPTAETTDMREIAIAWVRFIAMFLANACFFIDYDKIIVIMTL